MPIVFVHGVNVREGATYEKELRQRNLYLANIFSKLLGRNLAPGDIFSPYWGDLATIVTPGTPFLPTFATPTSTTKKILTHLAHGHDAHGHDNEEKLSLLSMAKEHPLEDVVDLIVAAAAETDLSTESMEAAAEHLSDFAYSALQFSKQFQSHEEQLAWLEGVHDDAQFLEKLEAGVAAESGAGKGSLKSMKHVRQAVSWMHDHWLESRQIVRSDLAAVKEKAIARAKTDFQKIRSTAKSIAALRRRATTHVTAAAITSPLRKLVHDRMFNFIGDAFYYFGQRGTPEAPGPIVSRIIDTIDSASKKIDAVNDPELILIAHSMGGNIACDVFSYFQTSRPIDVVITVGAQFPLFADLHMFPGLDTHNRPIAKPAHVKRWINIYDVNDVFGFAASPMFADIEDVEFTSGRFGVVTHADCFKMVSLYERMADAVLHPPVPLLGQTQSQA